MKHFLPSSSAVAIQASQDVTTTDTRPTTPLVMAAKVSIERSKKLIEQSQMLYTVGMQTINAPAHWRDDLEARIQKPTQNAD